MGSRVLESLLVKNRKVVLLKRSTSDIRRIKTFLNDARISTFDVDSNNLEGCFSVGNIEAVIHAATCYGRAGESVFDVIESNLRLPLKLLELSIKYGVSGFINTDTFGGNEKFYVKTKKDFVEYARGAINGSRLKFINLTIQHMYGPDDNPAKFFPFIIKKLLKNESADLTPGEQKRDFIFVEDCASAYPLVLEHLEELGQLEEFGLGRGEALPLRSIIEQKKKYIGSGSILKWGARPYWPDEIMYSRADISNNQKIKWTARHSLDEGIKKTVDYYRLHQ